METIFKHIFIAGLGLSIAACESAEVPKTKTPKLLDSLESLTIEALRGRDYNSSITIEAFDTDSCVGDHDLEVLPSMAGKYGSYMASFRSEGLRQYARITVPEASPPADGYPFILFLHGWIGKDKAPDYSIGCRPENLYYSELTDGFARAGYAVLAPGYRGHASVNDHPAEGIEYLEAFDQGSSLATQFYAVDALNFVAGLPEVQSSKFPDQSFKLDMSRFFMIGHSQGGDAGLTFLAVVGEGRFEHLIPNHTELWSGTFFDRLAALEEMKPVSMTSEAFLSGDGSWNGTAIGRNGEVNVNFLFAFPPDWIETPNPDEWTWQKESWSEPNVKSAVKTSAAAMYHELREGVEGLDQVSFQIEEDGQNGFSIRHDSRVSRVYPRIGGYEYPEFLSENMTFHVPEKDYYSRVAWNQDLCDRIMKQAGDCDLIVYPHNNHSMRASPHSWFSPEGTPDGYPQMIANMLEKFETYQKEIP